MIQLILLALMMAFLAAWGLRTILRAHGWIIGPIVHGTNYSKGLPLRPHETDDGWEFELDVGQEADGVTRDCNGLAGVKAIRFGLTVSDNPNAKLYPSEFPDRQAGITVFFQRRGDNFSGRGKYETYRWYSKSFPIKPGGFVDVDVPLEPAAWKAVGSTHGTDAPDLFKLAVENAGRIGIGFGSPGGRMHGICTTAPVEIEMFAWELVR